MTNNSRLIAYWKATDIDHEMVLITSCLPSGASTYTGCHSEFSGELREMRLIVSISQVTQLERCRARTQTQVLRGGLRGGLE